MAATRVGRGSDQFPLRLPDGLRERIKRHADHNGRSMNSEIVQLIESGLFEADMALMEQGLEPLRDVITDTDRKLIAYGKELVERIEADKRSAASGTNPLEYVPFFDDDEAARAFGESVEKQQNPQSTIIEERINALKAQTEYLEKLKAELLQLSKDRDEIKTEAEDLVKHQGEAIEMLVESQRATAAVLKDLANRPDPKMTGTPLTPDLFDKLFNQLARLEQKIDEGSKK
ncbi:Arc family DNA-binding protein [Ensifer sp. ENS07]|uniref:Arc family DNA-binding protein n=1 Tax=Ensifer sp. ENS07 TaxID=2769274 RepID=UPI00177FBF61|nr:Arc family DNA-binding protein [Ensifer sp. ENS07]MBD9640764.1 Arc family DNA-binding protein [Ensifer sp. ENS07]